MISTIYSLSSFNHLLNPSAALVGKAIPVAINAMRCCSRGKSTLAFVPHYFPLDEANRRFIRADQKRLFAPLITEKSKGLIASFKKDPMSKVYIPFFGVNASVGRTTYSGQYGIDRTYETTTSKGEVQAHHYTDWYSISGSIGRCEYDQNQEEMLVYGGFSWDSKIVENAFEGAQVTRKLKLFDPKLVEKSTFVDPFHKRLDSANRIGKERLIALETSRVEQEIRRRVSCDQVDVKRITVDYTNSPKLNAFLLPAYVLQYPDSPPRVMTALDNEEKIEGPCQISVSKSAAVGAAVATAAAFFIPPGLPVMSFIACGSLVGGLWAKHRLFLMHTWQQRTIRGEQQENDTYQETASDRERREATEGFLASKERRKVTEEFTTSTKFDIELDPFHCKILGLDPKLLITEEMVTHAFKEKIKIVHPDHKNGSAEKTRQVIESRDVLLRALRKNK